MPISWLNWAKLLRRFVIRLSLFSIYFTSLSFHIYFAESTLSQQTEAYGPEAHGSSRAEEKPIVLLLTFLSFYFALHTSGV